MTRRLLRITRLCLLAFLCFFFFSWNVHAADDGWTDVNELHFSEMEVDGEKVWLLEGYTGSEKEVIVPAEIEGKEVRAVSHYAFKGNETIESIILPDTVEIMGYEMFYDCPNLKNIYLGSMNRAWDIAHGYYWMLRECPNLESISMSDEANFDISSEPYSVGKDWEIFGKTERDNLKYIYIGSSMSNVTEDVFYGDSLEYIEVGENNPLYSSHDGVLYSADGKTLLVCGTSYQEETYEIPEGVETISPPGFEKCRNIKYIIVPETVKSMGGAFEDTDLTLIVKKNSYADVFAQENGMKVEYDGEASPEYESHIWNDTYTVDQEPTYTTAGVKSIHCKYCGKIKEGSQVSIPMLVEQSNGQSAGNQNFQLPNSENVTSGTSSDRNKQTVDGAVSKKLTKPILKKCKAGKKKVTVKWTKVSSVDGYQIQYAMNRKFKKNVRTITITKKNKTRKVIKKLKSGKKYFVRVRTYSKEGGSGSKTIYSAWSAVKKIKVK